VLRRERPADGSSANWQPSLVLGVSSGLVGLIIARFGTVALVALAPTNVPRLMKSPSILLCCPSRRVDVARMPAVWIGSGLSPSRVDVNDAPKQGGSRGTQGTGSALRRASGCGVAFSVAADGRVC
jgi:hypothetical protein